MFCLLPDDLLDDARAEVELIEQDIASTPDGYGYWFVPSDSGVFSFGTTAVDGSLGGKSLSARDRLLVAIALQQNGQNSMDVAPSGMASSGSRQRLVLEDS